MIKIPRRVALVMSGALACEVGGRRFATRRSTHFALSRYDFEGELEVRSDSRSGIAIGRMLG
jgi:hypothetical protein